jgi:hypothetical protein
LEVILEGHSAIMVKSQIARPALHDSVRAGSTYRISGAA